MFKKKKSKKAIEEIQEDVVVVEEAVEEIVIEAPEKKAAKVKKEVIQPESKKPQSFRSLREAKKYAKENGGKVVEKGRFYVR